MSYPPQILTDIPEDRVSEIVKSFRRDGAIKITQQQLRSGSWVVVAEFSEDEWSTKPKAKTRRIF